MVLLTLIFFNTERNYEANELITSGSRHCLEIYLLDKQQREELL